MALINRVSQLFKADLNAVLDHIEEPEQLLRQAVRDMEDELAISERRIKACAQEHDALEARKHDVQSSTEELEEQLDLCFESGKDELAKNIIRRRLEAQRLVKRLQTQIEANLRFISRERKLLDENRATLEGLRQKAEFFINRAPSVDAEAGSEFSSLAREFAVSDDEVEIAFLREKSTRGAS